MNDGYIRLYRKFVEWEWYSNVNDRLVFIHCLLSANWKDGYFEGQKIPRGSFITSYQKLAKEIGISVQNVRTSINHLKSTSNLTSKITNKYSIITINNYDKYQETNKQINKQLTSNQQATNNNRINNNKEINKKESISKDIPKKEVKYFESLKVNSLFNDFLEVRKKLKAVNSERAINMLIKQLNNYDEETQCEMIEQSIVNSWKGLFELKNKKEKSYSFTDLLKESMYEQK